MGLLFQTPVELNDLDDRIQVNDGKLILRSYGLPMIFWGYLAAIFMVLFFMILAVIDPLYKVLTGDDTINQMIGFTLLTLLILGPLTLLAFYFYEKEITKKQNKITITHKTFFLPLKKKTFEISELAVEHFFDGPNIAAIEKREGMQGFENRGYFMLMATTTNQQKIMIDRNGRKGEMKKLKLLLENY